MASLSQKHKKLPSLACACNNLLLCRAQRDRRVPHDGFLTVEGSQDSSTYQNTNLPILSTLYASLSKQLISVLGERYMQTSTADRLQHQRAIQAKCVHPTGTFLPFAEGEVEHSLPARFEQQVRRHPARLAVKTPHAHLTYAALNQAANRVAHALLTHCGPGEAPIALLL